MSLSTVVGTDCVPGYVVRALVLFLCLGGMRRQLRERGLCPLARAHHRNRAHGVDVPSYHPPPRLCAAVFRNEC